MWNIALRNESIEAFVSAAHRLNEGRMRYTWLRYLPYKADITGFFKPFQKQLIERVRTEPLLENWNGEFVSASTLTYVSAADYCDEQGRPLTLGLNNPTRGASYLSPRYSKDDLECLKALGVTEMEHDVFIKHLRAYIRDFSEEFQSRPAEWHAKLAEVLIPMANDIDYRAAVKGLKLVPLRDGQWTSMNEVGRAPIWFPGNAAASEIPQGISLLVLDQVASSNHLRYQLYGSIGVKPCDIFALVDFIIERHSSPDYNPRWVSRAALISQAVFLSSINASFQENQTLWVMTERGDRVPASTAYLDSDEEFSATKCFEGHRHHVNFLHPAYLTAVPEKPRPWIRWMTKHASISKYPRLATAVALNTFQISSDFENIATRDPILALKLLKARWDEYSLLIETNERPDATAEERTSKAALREKLAAIMIPCKGGSRCRLDETFLPSREIVSTAMGCVPLLDLPDPNDPRWPAVLRPLGVGVKNDLNLYLKCLYNVKTKNLSTEKVSAFLEQIQARCSEDEALVR